MTTHQPSTSTTARDHRLTLGLFADVIEVLEQHGYAQPTEQSARNRATGATLAELARLVRAFEGAEQ